MVQTFVTMTQSAVVNCLGYCRALEKVTQCAKHLHKRSNDDQVYCIYSSFLS